MRRQALATHAAHSALGTAITSAVIAAFIAAATAATVDAVQSDPLAALARASARVAVHSDARRRRVLWGLL